MGRYHGSLKGKQDYELISAGAKFGFDLENLFKENNTRTDFKDKKQLIEFVAEPYIGGIVSPDSNFETGCGFLLKYGYKMNKFMPFIQAGTGVQYSTQHLNEQSTQWNFQVQGGVGMGYFFQENKCVNVEYRVRHFSNASLKSPNTGVDLESILLGISYFF